MFELSVVFGGFVLALFAFSAVAQWVGAIYVELINQPPEVRRPQVILSLLLLHSGPWVLALLLFGVAMVVRPSASEWRPWLIAGFTAGVALQTIALVASLAKVRAQRGTTHEG